MNELFTFQNPPINFEGKLVKPNKKGVYKCPFKCKDNGYAQPTWKTEKGFRNHMESCTGRPSYVEKVEQQQAQARSDDQMRYEAAMEKCPYKIGDTLIWVREIILKPTHVMRGGRLRHVRYEAVETFVAEQITVKSVDWQGTYKVNGYREIFDFRIFDGSLADAQIEAADRLKKYNEGVEFARMCR